VTKQHKRQQQQQRQLQMARLASPWQRKVLLLMEGQGGRPSSAQCMPTMHPRLHTAAAGYAPTQAPHQPSSNSSNDHAAGVLLQQLLAAQRLQVRQLQARTAAGQTASGSAACRPSPHLLLQKTPAQMMLGLGPCSALVAG
jgi:hypothetical protein